MNTTFLNSFKPYKDIIFILIILILCFSLNQSCHNNSINNQNLIALTDTLKTYHNKNNELVSEKAIIVSDNLNLKGLNDSLDIEIKKEHGKVKTIIKVKTVYDNSINDIPVTITKLNDSTFYSKFDTTYKDLGITQNLAGQQKISIENNTIKVDSFNLTKNSVELNLFVGLKQKGDTLKIWAKSKSNKVSITELEGATVPLQRVKYPKFGFGPQIGVGINQNGTPSVFVGIGLTYNLYNGSHKQIFSIK